MSDPYGPKTVSMGTCAACGEEHNPTVFEPLIEPKIVHGKLCHWSATCPRNGRVVYLAEDLEETV